MIEERLQSRVQFWNSRRNALIEGLRERPRGLSWCYDYTKLIDEIFRELVGGVEGLADSVAVIAVGGYGRQELSPHSDLDLTLVPIGDGSPNLDASIRRFIRELHWVFNTGLRLDVAYAYRLPADAPGLDAKTRTGLLDARLIVGSAAIFRQLMPALEESFSAGEFILDKINERQEQLRKTNDTPLAVEPHLKEGAGGIRCFNCANWLRLAINERERRPSRSYDAVIEMRNLLHLVSGKLNDRLTRGRQEEIAALKSDDPLQMMSRHCAYASEVHGEYLESLDKLHEARFQLARGGIAMRGEARIINGADAGDAAVAISVATSLGIRIPEVAAGVSGVTGPAAAYALSQGEASIRNIDQCGLLESLLPELTECRNLIPDDSVHAYTVFEHSLRLVRVIENFKPGSWLFNVRESSLDLEHLILAALLHDIGKQIDDERHSEIGADMATEILTRWRVSDNMIRQVSWMIRNHLAISHVLRFRDLADPATIHEFAELVQNRERLGLLTILAYADISSVAPGVMTPALEGAFEELYFRTLDLLETAALMPQEKQRRRLTEELQKEPVTDEVVEDFVSGLPVHYLNSTPIERTRDHIHMVERARNGEIVIETRSQPDQGATEFTVCCHDAPGLLSRILGCFYALDLRVQQIRICTTATERIALDTFLVNFSNRALAKATADLAMSQLRGVLDGSQAVEDLLTKNGKDPTREQRVLNYRFIEGNPGILEIRAPRGRGLPYRLCRWIATQGWNITSARMGQWAENASAAVYLTRGDGGELTAQEVDAAFEQRQTL